MLFSSPSWVPELSADPPDSISIADFMSNQTYGRYPLAHAKSPFVCGLTGKSHSAAQVIEQEKNLAKAIAARLNLTLEGSEWNRVVTVFSLNTIDYVPLTHAIHRLSGIVALAGPTCTVSELENQLQSATSIALFTCVPLLGVALEAARAKGIPDERIFILPMPGDCSNHGFKTIYDLIEEGKKLPNKKPLNWTKGQGERQVAYLCFSSGTSGMPKAVMISHRNVIANIMQLTTFESFYRREHKIDSQVLLGLLPFSHAYGLVIMAHVAPYRGDQVIVLPNFQLDSFLTAIQRFKIEQLNIVPPILVQMLANHEKCKEFDLSSVRFIYTGGAPLGSETIQSLSSLYPHWHLGQVYGMTETAVVITSTSESDILHGSSGSLLPGIRAKIINADGHEVTAVETPGELLVQGPSVTLGYLNNEKATTETFVWDEDGRWIRTGDEAIVRKSAQGHDHFVIIDRIKELIKVKGMQVAPAELEAHILAHPFVSDCAVVQTQHETAGEVPKAFVVRSKQSAGKSETETARIICEYVEKHKARYKWLVGGVEFLDVIPKNATGKILRRLLRGMEAKSRKPKDSRL